ncbi:hypothetical protein DdX_11069 [Ditylenchus destructor]|uniref:Secreted protein n=1 Tax=Ditylenchus destructor TaxID=166010 RepID=A0AAD4R1G5_9BILA|nr:hypothetical protein DdX_11069 [Ditylenchus destructor]
MVTKAARLFLCGLSSECLFLSGVRGRWAFPPDGGPFVPCDFARVQLFWLESSKRGTQQLNPIFAALSCPSFNNNQQDRRCWRTYADVQEGIWSAGKQRSAEVVLSGAE